MGFGLFGCCEIAKHSKGELIIISGNNKLTCSGGNIEILPSSKFDGTMVSLSMPRDAIINLESIFGKTSLVLDSVDSLFEDFNE